MSDPGPRSGGPGGPGGTSSSIVTILQNIVTAINGFAAALSSNLTSVIGNGRLATMPPGTVKGNATGGTAIPQDIAALLARSSNLLNIESEFGATDQNVTLPSTVRLVLFGNNTAARTITMPPLASVNPGTRIYALSFSNQNFATTFAPSGVDSFFDPEASGGFASFVTGGNINETAVFIEFVANQTANWMISRLSKPVPNRAGDIIYWNGSKYVTLAGNNSGTQVLQETSAGVPSWVTIAAAPPGDFVSRQTFSASQTITIPATATKGIFQGWGGTGGSGGGGNVSLFGFSGGVGAAGYFEKTLTGLTPGNTLVWTQGAAGAAGATNNGTGGNGGASTLASGTQTITTLTANGSNGSISSVINSTPTVQFSPGTVGGTATNGDVNETGQTGTFAATDGANNFPGIGGNNHYSKGPDGVAAASGPGIAGTPGGLIVTWFT